MSWTQGLAQRLRVVFRFSRVESELDRELRHHLELDVEQQIRDGIPLPEARRRALQRVGNLEALKEEVRDERGSRVVTDAIDDLRVGWRGLLRTPGFTIAVVLSLVIGVGATTALFGVIQAVLLRPLPYPDADRLHEIRVTWGGEFSATLSAADFLRLREESKGVADVAASRLPSNGFTLMTKEGPIVVQGAIVTADMPRVLSVAPVLGHWPSLAPGAAEALISTELWRQQFGGGRDVIGRTITLDGNAYNIAGVMPRGYNLPGQSEGAVWVTMRVNEPTRRGPFVLSTLARLHSTVTAEAAAARLTGALTPILRDRYGADSSWRYRVRPMKDVLVGDVRSTLVLALGAVSLVLFVAIANVANLLLARGTTRARELAVRASLGAARGRLARQLLAESGLLGTIGGVFGVGVAFLLLTVVGQLARAFVPRLEEVRIDAGIVGFALIIGTAAGLLAGLLPVFRLPWNALADALRDGGRRGGESARRGRVRSLLVAFEIALTLSVAANAGLLVKSLIRLQAVDPGFRAEGVLSFRLSLPVDPYGDTARLDAFLTTLEARLRALPGVSSVAYVTSLPPDKLQWENNYTIEGDRPETRGAEAVAQWINATPDYFTVLGIPVISGRAFTDVDRAGSLRVAIVSQSFVRRHFPHGDAVGRRFKGGGWDPRTPWTTIVGVVGDVPYERGVWGGTSPAIYLSHAQTLGVRSPYVVLKTRGRPNSLVPDVRRTVLGVDASVPPRDVASMQERLHGQRPCLAVGACCSRCSRRLP